MNPYDVYLHIYDKCTRLLNKKLVIKFKEEYGRSYFHPATYSKTTYKCSKPRRHRRFHKI